MISDLVSTRCSSLVVNAFSYVPGANSDIYADLAPHRRLILCASLSSKEVNCPYAISSSLLKYPILKEIPVL